MEKLTDTRKLFSPSGLAPVITLYEYLTEISDPDTPSLSPAVCGVSLCHFPRTEINKTIVSDGPLDIRVYYARLI